MSYYDLDRRARVLAIAAEAVAQTQEARGEYHRSFNVEATHNPFFELATLLAEKFEADLRSLSGWPSYQEAEKIRKALKKK